MTDERHHADDDGPDGWLVMHTGTHAIEQDTGPYGFGPFPSRDIAEYISTNTKCKCVKGILPVFFPHGVRLFVEVPADAVVSALANDKALRN